MKMESERKILFNIDVSKLKMMVSELSQNDWLYVDIRQKIFSIHKDTESIILIWEFKDRKTSISKDLTDEILQIAEQIRKYYGENSKISKLMLVKLPAKKQINSHIDAGTLEEVHRCHLPIVTNEQNIFIINNKPFFFKEGEVSEFDNTEIHSFVNESEIDRVHLLCDINE